MTKNDNDFKFKSSNLLDLSVRNFVNIFYNDFENKIFDRFPNMLKIKELLYQEQAEFASLSGSGSAIYGIFSSPDMVNEAVSKLSKLYSCKIAKPVYYKL